MNNKLEDYKNYIKSKKVAVLGVGISNTPLIKYLAALGTDITAFDKSDENEIMDTIKEFEGLNIKYSLGKDYLNGLKGFDVIFKTPKIRFDLPELMAEKERGAVVTSEMEVFCELCPAKIFAVTGSDGKTTTTTLIYLMLKEQGYNCWLGGNIGTALLDKIDHIEETDMVVLELSSFQLHTMKNRLNYVVVTNMSPNHLDVHTSMDEYIDAKKNIFCYQTENDLLVLNNENNITKKFASEAKSKVVFFSRTVDMPIGMVLVEGKIIYKTGKEQVEIMKASEIKLPGVHNIENYMAAAAVVIDHVKPEVIRKIALTFGGVEHRNEFVRELRGIRFFNDSIGSSPTRTIASVKAFDQKVILITGGYDKHIPYDEMSEIFIGSVKCLVLMGQTAPKIEEVFNKTGVNDVPLYKCNSMEDAIKKAYENAAENDIIILSPASASFDMFKNFEERGNIYKKIVNNLT